VTLIRPLIAASAMTAALLAFPWTARHAMAAGSNPYSDVRRQFMDAYQAARRGPATTTVADSAALREYPLYPYVVAERLERRLGDPSAAGDIEAFLGRYGDQPVARTLRRDWLMTLALRKQWDAYLAAYREDVDDTVAARCNMFVARIALGRTDGLADAVVDQWLTPKSLPDACDPAFDWLRMQGLLTPQLIERRAKAALGEGEAGLARYLARSLPDSMAAPINQWAALIAQPKASIDALITSPERSIDPSALLDGWQRYARSDPDGAADRFPALVSARKLDPQAAGPFALAVALPLSWRRNVGALEFFDLAHPDDFDERAHEWHVRSALWAGDWARVRKAIEAMPESLRSQNRWKYWSARAAEQLGDREAAKLGYESVLPTDNWYAVLSAAHLGRSFAPSQEPMGITEAGINKLAGQAALVRTHELVRCDLQTEANREWRAALDQLSTEEQIQAIGLAADWGWYLQAIAAAAKLGYFNDYEFLYPRPYDPEVRRGAAVSGLPADFIYAIIRQESLYKADARSSAGALGLMQLLPSTARRTARAWDMPRPSNASLLIPSVNVPLGSVFLRSLLDRAGGQAPLAMAAYNAGPGAVRRWLPDAPMSMDVWVENIPYNETRGYVQRVSWHMIVFGWLTERKPRDVAAWLGNVNGLTGGDDVDSG
jgi:soluble lytic murein transglycosylase